MANQSKLKAWVRYDGTGRVISGGPIFQVNKPKVGNWKQIDANLCCNGALTTTTTTTGGGGITPTAWVGKAADRNYDSAQRACNNPDAIIVLYTSTDTFPIPVNTVLYTDAALTTLISTTYPDYVNVSINDWVFGVAYGGSVGSGEPCSNFNTTTTTTTTQAPVNSALFRESTDYGTVCAQPATIFIYWTGTLTNGTQIFTNQQLTQGYNNLGYIANAFTNEIFSTSNGLAFAAGFC